MAAIAFRTTSVKSGFFLSALVGMFADWNDARMTRKALSALSARELDDIGLVAGDIDAIANGRVTR